MHINNVSITSCIHDSRIFISLIYLKRLELYFSAQATNDTLGLYFCIFVGIEKLVIESIFHDTIKGFILT